MARERRASGYTEADDPKRLVEFDRVMACAQAAGIDLTARLRNR